MAGGESGGLSECQINCPSLIQGPATLTLLLLPSCHFINCPMHRFSLSQLKGYIYSEQILAGKDGGKIVSEQQRQEN